MSKLLPERWTVTITFTLLFAEDIAYAHWQRLGSEVRDFLGLVGNFLWLGCLEAAVFFLVGNLVHPKVAVRMMDAIEGLLAVLYRSFIHPFASFLGLTRFVDFLANGPTETTVQFDDGRYDGLVERVSKAIAACPPGKKVVFRRDPSASISTTGSGTNQTEHLSNITRDAAYKKSSASIRGQHPVDVASLPAPDSDLTTAHLVQFLNPPENTLLKVGPSTPMSTILRECQARSRLPSIVPEFPGLTAGGCLTGGGIETSSFRFGQWADNGGIAGIECVDGEGRFHRLALGPRRARRESFIVTDDAATDDDEREPLSPSPELSSNDLKSSFGSLGVLTSLTLHVHPHPAGDHVKLSYILCRSPQPLLAVIREVVRMGSVDFVEGLVFSRREYVCIVGCLVTDTEVAEARRKRFLFGKNGTRGVGRSEGVGELVRFDCGFDEYYFRHARR